MTAVGIAALADELAHLGEALGQAPRLDAPEPDLAEPRRVHEVSAALERDHDRADRRLPAASDLCADLSRAKPEPGLNRVEQTRLSSAGRAGYDRGRAHEDIAKHA